MDYIDLHTHSTYSDGIMQPAELVDFAAGVGLKAIALTDHDTMDGVAEALTAGRSREIEVVPGIEISAWHEGVSMHILGYWLKHDDPQLLTRLAGIQAARRTRNAHIIANLNRMGIDVSMAELADYSLCGQTGRPHIASLLVAKGVVPDRGKAFALYLRKGAAAYAERFRFGAAEAIPMIREAGGLAVLAHPYYLDPSLKSIPGLLAKLKGLGLGGVEVYYPGYYKRTVKVLKQLAEDMGLVVTGGSDLHGDSCSELALDVKRKKFYVPYYLLEIMKETGRN